MQRDFSRKERFPIKNVADKCRLAQKLIITFINQDIIGVLDKCSLGEMVEMLKKEFKKE